MTLPLLPLDVQPVPGAALPRVSGPSELPGVLRDDHYAVVQLCFYFYFCN